MTEDTERLSAACSCCGHRYTYPARIEEKAVMRCPHCREYIHVRTGLPLGQGSDTPSHAAAQTEKQPATLQLPPVPAVDIGTQADLPARHHTDGISAGKAPAATGPAGSLSKTPIPAILILAGILLPVAWILISPDDRETYVYDAKDGSFAICWPYIRWSISVLLCLPCILAAVIVHAVAGTGR